MGHLHFRNLERMDKRASLSFTLFFGPGTTNAASTSFILHQRVVAAAGAGKGAVFLHKDLNSNPGKGQCNKQDGKQYNGHT